MSAREELFRFMAGGWSLTEAEAAPLYEAIDKFAHELVDRARRGVDVLEEHVGGFQYARDVREILDVVDPTTPDPDGWDF
jgi:hypothetical protein